ncbi:MAG: patatin-like phospholipase family protein [Candidatus Nanopelagicales bacterium]
MRTPVTVVTTFGLARTPAQIGMLDVLVDQGISPDYFVGTSLGAVNAAASAAGCSTEQMRDFWIWIDEEILSSPIRSLARSMSTRQSRKQEEQVRERLAAFLPATFDGLERPLRLLCTDLETGTRVIVEQGDLPTAVMASCALPGLFPPVEMGTGYVIDGGLVAGMPLRAVPVDTRTVIVLDTGNAVVSQEQASAYRWWEVGMQAYAHLIRGQSVHALMEVGARVPVVVISTSSGQLLDFDSPSEAIDAGRHAAETQLAALPARLRKGIYGLPPGLNEFESLHEICRDIE